MAYERRDVVTSQNGWGSSRISYTRRDRGLSGRFEMHVDQASSSYRGLSDDERHTLKERGYKVEPAGKGFGR